MKAHGHKVVFIHASHRHILLPSTFRLLHVASRYDVVLKAFIDTAYRTLRTEANIASHSTSDGHVRRFTLPNTFEQLAEGASVQDLRSLPLALTTLAQVAVVLASKDELRDAMQGDFAALWDPESHLAITVFRSVDVTCRLELMAKAIDAIKLAYWLDFYTQNTPLAGSHDARKRVNIHASQEGISAITKKCSANGIQAEETASGIVIAIDEITHLETLLSNDDDGQRRLDYIATEVSLVPVWTSNDCLMLREDLQSRLIERNIKASLKYDQGPSQQSGARDALGLDLAQLFSTLDFGRSQQQFKNALDLAQEQLAASRVHTSRIDLVLLGGSMRDEHARSAAGILSSLKIAYIPVKLLDLLYPKDSHRHGDEPVPSSKVRGAPCQQIAIIGMSCRVPGANDADELWQLLKEGKSMCKEVSAEACPILSIPCVLIEGNETDTSDIAFLPLVCKPQIPAHLYRYQDYHSVSYRERNVMRVKTGNFVDSPGLVDESILEHVAHSGDCAKIDPQQRVAILTAYEALQKAGYGFSPHRRPEKPEQWSTHLAYCSDDYREHLSQNIEGDFVANTHRAHLVARLNETFGFRGEACTYDTACSSALVAVEAACNSLLSGETSAALSGGVNILTQPQITIGLDRGFFLSPSTQCMTLDDAGAGYSRADAVSIMLLKRLPDAVRDGDPILALISSAATNHSGESFSITHPHGPTQKRLYQAGMIASKTLPHDYSYIEMHGTGTQSGDFEEVSGIVQTFGQGKRGEASPLVLGSVKANIGHSEAASGASSMIKTVKIYEHGEIPRHIGIRTKLNTKLPPLDGLHVPLQETKLDRVDTAFTLVDNFSAAGGNSSIVMDRGTTYRDRLLQMSKDALDVAVHSGHGSDDKHHLLFVTAATAFSLDAKRRRLIAFLDENKHMSLTEFCSTVSLGDLMLSHRLIATPANIAEAKTCLCSQEAVLITSGPSNGASQSIGIVFSGQGAQYLDMARELYEQSPAFRRHVDNCNTIALSLQLPSLVEVIHPPRTTLDTSQTEARAERKADIFNAVQYQLALIAVEVGLASMLLDWGLTPSCAAGHSLGEYAALWLAGALSLRSLIELVGRRAMLMIEMCAPNASTMLAIREGDGKVEQLLGSSGNEQLEIACLNSPNDTVVAGPNEEIEKLRNFCEQSDPKIMAMSIPVPYAFHSKAVEPLMGEYRKVVARHAFSKPMIPLASNLFGKVIEPEGAQIDGSYLVSHLRRPVLFSASISDMQKRLVIDAWVEIGPHPICTPMLKGCYAASTHVTEFLSSFRKGSSSWTATLNLVKELASRGIDLRWENVFADLGLRFRHRGLAEELPLYPFDLDECWVPFKDRGLRDHLIATSAYSDPSEGGRHSSEATRVAPTRRPKPFHSLLRQCVKLEGTPPSAMFLARVSQRPFRDFIRGHVILGVPLAPATVFIELAQEAGMYWWQMDPCKQRPITQSSEDVVVEVLELSMVASLYLNEHDSKQSIEVTMQGNPTSNDGSIVQFFSHSEHQHQQHQYASCRIRIISKEQVAREWVRLQHLILRTVSTIKSQPACMIRTETIYKSFEAIVLYLGGFRGMKTIWMTEHGDEAVSEVSHHADAVDGQFLCSPMLLDSLGGLTGFISNVSFAEGPFVYMAEAIGRIVIMPAVGKIEPGSSAKLQVYARMERDKELSKGSAYFFLPDGELMGSMENIAFKRIRRDMLSRLVQLSSKAFASEAAKAAESSARSEALNVPPNAVGPQDSCGTASKTATKFPPRTITTAFRPVPCGHDANSSMNELTNPDKRYTLSAPVHIGGPRSRHFDGRNVLFVFPDGSGTAQTLPKLEFVDSPSIYGFDSPFLGHTEAWSRGIAELIDRFVELLRSVKPQGPYKLAGWSIGGIFALEVSRRLLSAGQQVAFVGFIDTPSPKQIQPLPAVTLDEMLKPITSNTVREHFRSCASSLPEYRCLALQSFERLPEKIMIVNATSDSKLKGVIATEGDWRAFWLGSKNVFFHEVDGDHWSCLRPALDLIVRSAQEQS